MRRPLIPPGEGCCRKCAASILWLKTPTGKWMPVDKRPSARGIVEIREGRASTPVAVVVSRENPPTPGAERYTPHWGTCAQGDLFRRRGSEARP